eukprot:scaffold88540_cov61-Phaeocystis_antarctica.AAC.7
MAIDRVALPGFVTVAPFASLRAEASSRSAQTLVLATAAFCSALSSALTSALISCPSATQALPPSILHTMRSRGRWPPSTIWSSQPSGTG